MSKESIIAFSQAKAEPLWLQDLRQAAFDKLDGLALPKIERVKFHRWNLGDGTIAENESSANVPDFTALGNNPKLVQVGTNTVLEQLPSDLINQGLVFTILGVPITDTVVAIVRRKLSGRPAMEADKMHLHHRLLAMGFTHRGAVLVVYAIATLFSLIALLLNVSSRLGGILLLLSLLLGMEILIEGLEIWGIGRTPLFNFLKFIGNSDYRQAIMLKWKQGRKK